MPGAEILEGGAGLDRERDGARSEDAFLLSRKINQPGQGVENLRLHLVALVGEQPMRRFLRPGEEQPGMHAVVVALEGARELIGLEAADHANEKMLDIDRRAAEPLDHELLPFHASSQNSRSDPLEYRPMLANSPASSSAINRAPRGLACSSTASRSIVLSVT